MPMYDYLCEQHGRFDAFNSVEDYQKPAKCPKCGSESPRLPSLGTAINMGGTMSISRRTDVEISSVDMMDSVNSFKK